MQDEDFDILLQKADPDRRLAALFATPQVRDRLLALYAFNHELGKIADASTESMIGEMKLTWWRDAVGDLLPRDGLASGNRRRRETDRHHRVVGRGGCERRLRVVERDRVVEAVVLIHLGCWVEDVRSDPFDLRQKGREVHRGQLHSELLHGGDDAM